MSASDPFDRFASAMSVPPAAAPLDEAVAAIAAAGRPAVDVDDVLAGLDALAAGVDEATSDGVRAALFLREGFEGDRSSYDDPANSLLDRVLARRRGMPITLSVVLVEVARRVGVPLVGVGMPGHFLVGDPEAPGTYLDPFDRGRVLDATACRDLFVRLHPGRPFDPNFLAPVDARAVCRRILANLAASYRRRSDRPALLRVLELTCLVPPAPPAVRRELSLLYAAIGRYGDAADQLEAVGGSSTDLAARRLRARLN